MNRKPRQRMCKICRTKYQPTESFQQWCSPDCAIELLRLKQAKDRRKQDAKERQRLKPRSKWIRETQATFNKWIRCRDDRKPCVSCGKHHTGQYHAGHLYTTAARPDLRFNEDNCHKQCSVCNNHLSGNIINYKETLIQRIGQERVDALEVVGRSDWSIEELIEIKKYYLNKIKELKPK